MDVQEILVDPIYDRDPVSVVLTSYYRSKGDDIPDNAIVDENDDYLVNERNAYLYV